MNQHETAPQALRHTYAGDLASILSLVRCTSRPKNAQERCKVHLSGASWLNQ